MIVETSPVVPSKDNDRIIPIRTLHDVIDQSGDISLPGMDGRCRMVTNRIFWNDP